MDALRNKENARRKETYGRKKGAAMNFFSPGLGHKLFFKINY